MQKDPHWLHEKIEQFEKEDYEGRERILDELSLNGFHDDVENIKLTHCFTCLGSKKMEELNGYDEISLVPCHCSEDYKEPNNY